LRVKKGRRAVTLFFGGTGRRVCAGSPTALLRGSIGNTLPGEVGAEGSLPGRTCSGEINDE